MSGGESSHSACAHTQHLEDGRLPLTNVSGALSTAWIVKLLPWQTLGFQ